MGNRVYLQNPAGRGPAMQERVMALDADTGRLVWEYRFNVFQSDDMKFIADVLFGDVNPGGKLPVTFPRAVGQVPLYYNHMNTGRPADPGNKYTSKYLDASWTPLYPFGYGLSYTQFRLSNLQVSAKANLPLPLTVSVEVENTGRRAGDEVVQLYIRDVAASITRPVKELKGFQRVTLRAGEKRRLEFTLTPELLGFYNREMRFVVEPGDFQIMVGTSSADEHELQTTFKVASQIAFGG